LIRAVPRTGDDGSTLSIRLFGALEIVDGGRILGPRDLGGSRPKQVLEILLAARGHHVPTDRLAELLWGGERPDDVNGSIQTFVSVLRRHLVADRARARDLVVTEAEAYRFATDKVELDLDRFDSLLERSASEPTRAARRSLSEALGLARGDVLEDEPYTTWAGDLRGTYRGRGLGAHLDAADAALAERDFSAALGHSDAAIALDRFSERAHRGRILAQYALGDAHQALGSYRDFRRLLDEELGLEPSADTRALETAILRQAEPEPLLPRAITTPSAVFEPRTPLVGRHRELAALSDAIHRGIDGGFTLIQVNGETGFGKTRLLDELAGELSDVRVGRTACSPLEQQLSYVPLAASLRDARLCAAGHVEAYPALRGILPELDSARRADEFDDVEVLEALIGLVEEHAPVVLFVDDLQWADPRTIAALGYLRRRGRGPRGAVVVTVRPTAAPADHDLWSLEPDLTIDLDVLEREDVDRLGIPELYERTGGNPRFVAEAMRTGEAAPSKSLAEALIAQCRAEGLWGCRILTTAALLEQPFDPLPLAALLDTDPGSLSEELEAFCERRILRVDGLRFRFRYAVVRDVLLESISPARRTLLLARLRATDDPVHDIRVAGTAR
jgi:DNA-binding SARP family transcriptional activator